MLLAKQDMSISPTSATPIPAPNRVPIAETKVSMVDMVTVFLGGTCNGSKWRDKFIPMLSSRFDPFNPVVDDWNEEAQREEEYHKANDEYIVFCITPKMTGFFSIVEMIHSMHVRPYTTFVCFLNEDGGSKFTIPQMKSIDATVELLEKFNVKTFTSLEDMVEYMNNIYDDTGIDHRRRERFYNGR